MPFPAASFDVVPCRLAPPHFDSVPAFLAEAARVLVPAGRLLIADTTVRDGDPELDQWQDRVERLRDPSHRRSYSPAEWTAFLTQAGFSISEIDSVSGFVPITLNAWLAKAGCTRAAQPSAVPYTHPTPPTRQPV